MKASRLVLALGLGVSLAGFRCGDDAPGRPGGRATWTNGNKQGVGTATSLESKVWFTLGDGALSEVYYPTLDRAQTRLLELVVADGKGFLESETADTTHEVRLADPRALAFEQVNRSRTGRYRIRKAVIADPARPVVLIHLRFEPEGDGPLRLFVFFDPALANSGLGDSGSAGPDALTAREDGAAVALVSTTGFAWANSGYLGRSDGRAELAAGKPLPRNPRTRDGNVAQMAELPVSGTATELTLALGFGSDEAAAAAGARASLGVPFVQSFEAYASGWRSWLATLNPVRAEWADAYAAAAMTLKAHEDKTARGAMIASLTVPWGDEQDAGKAGVGGYHLVWSRDLYQVATAFIAMGDRAAAERALDYLFRVQQKPDGSFPQNSWLDGRPYWTSLQLDEVAFPLLLAHELGRTDADTWRRHVRPAAEFILAHGPATPQERWEEEPGYSPSTIAAEIAGLVAASEIARLNGDGKATQRFLAAADEWAGKIESWTVTRTGPLSAQPYFLRLSQDGRPDSGRRLEINNGGGRFDERAIVDAGFLELVRLGIRPASDRLVVGSLEVIDRVLRVETPHGPAFYRYNHDGYGEKADGRGYDGTGGGRLWPLLTGERGEYELAAGRDARPYLETLLRFANPGRMLPEQVWDRPEAPRPHLRFGQGTGSATPLAWSCAQLVRLARGIEEGRVVEMPDVVRRHFQAR